MIEGIQPTPDTKRLITIIESGPLNKHRTIVAILQDDILSPKHIDKYDIACDDYQFPVIGYIHDDGVVEIDISRIGPDRIYPNLRSARDDIELILEANNIIPRKYAARRY